MGFTSAHTSFDSVFQIRTLDRERKTTLTDLHSFVFGLPVDLPEAGEVSIGTCEGSIYDSFDIGSRSGIPDIESYSTTRKYCAHLGMVHAQPSRVEL